MATKRKAEGTQVTLEGDTGGTGKEETQQNGTFSLLVFE